MSSSSCHDCRPHRCISLAAVRCVASAVALARDAITCTTSHSCCTVAEPAVVASARTTRESYIAARAAVDAVCTPRDTRATSADDDARACFANGSAGTDGSAGAVCARAGVAAGSAGTLSTATSSIKGGCSAAGPWAVEASAVALPAAVGVEEDAIAIS